MTLAPRMVRSDILLDALRLSRLHLVARYRTMSLPPRDGNAFFPTRIISRSHVCTVTLPFNSNCYLHQVMRKYGFELLHVLSCLRHTPLSYTVTLCLSFPEYDRELDDDLQIYSWSFDHDFGAEIFLLESCVVLRCLSSPDYCFKLFTMNIKDSKLGRRRNLERSLLGVSFHERLANSLRLLLKPSDLLVSWCNTARVAAEPSCPIWLMSLRDSGCFAWDDSNTSAHRLSLCRNT